MEGVGVVKDEELKFEEIEVLHTLGREGSYIQEIFEICLL